MRIPHCVVDGTGIPPDSEKHPPCKKRGFFESERNEIFNIPWNTGKIKRKTFLQEGVFTIFPGIPGDFRK
jgi:hypothetical protein